MKSKYKLIYNFFTNNFLVILYVLALLIFQMTFSIKIYGDITPNLFEFYSYYNNKKEINDVINSINSILSTNHKINNKIKLSPVDEYAKVNRTSNQENKNFNLNTFELNYNNNKQDQLFDLCNINENNYKNNNTPLINQRKVNHKLDDKKPKILHNSNDRFVYYEIKSGDTLESISYKFYKTNKMVIHLVRLNRIQNYKSIKPGMLIKLPRTSRIRNY